MDTNIEVRVAYAEGHNRIALPHWVFPAILVIVILIIAIVFKRRNPN